MSDLIKVFKGDADRSYENRFFFKEFVTTLKAFCEQYDVEARIYGHPKFKQDEYLQPDNIIFTRSAIIIVDFKNYDHDINLPEPSKFFSGQWSATDGSFVVGGGSSVNPFEQLRKQEKRLLSVLRGVDGIDEEPRIIKMVVFQKNIKIYGSIPGKYEEHYVVCNSEDYLREIVSAIKIRSESSGINITDRGFQDIRSLCIVQDFTDFDKLGARDQEKIDELLVENEALRRDKEKLSTQARRSIAMADDALARARRSEDELKGARDNIRSLERSLRRATAATEEAQAQLAEVKAAKIDHSDAEKELTKAKKRQSEIQEELDKARGERNELYAAWQEAETAKNEALAEAKKSVAKAERAKRKAEKERDFEMGRHEEAIDCMKNSSKKISKSADKFSECVDKLAKDSHSNDAKNKTIIFSAIALVVAAIIAVGLGVWHGYSEKQKEAEQLEADRLSGRVCIPVEEVEDYEGKTGVCVDMFIGDIGANKYFTYLNNNEDHSFTLLVDKDNLLYKEAEEKYLNRRVEAHGDIIRYQGDNFSQLEIKIENLSQIKIKE